MTRSRKRNPISAAKAVEVGPSFSKGVLGNLIRATKLPFGGNLRFLQTRPANKHRLVLTGSHFYFKPYMSANSRNIKTIFRFVNFGKHPEGNDTNRKEENGPIYKLARQLYLASFNYYFRWFSCLPDSWEKKIKI